MNLPEPRISLSWFRPARATSDMQLAWCQGTALAVQAAQGALGLAASGGTDLPGSASTLGWRTKGSPRFALSLWGSVIQAPTPAMVERDGLPGGEDQSELPLLPHLRDDRCVRWILTRADGGRVRLPGPYPLGPMDRDPDRERVPGQRRGWGAGARIGILRESFSLPGISISGFHRSLGSHDLWSIDEGDPSEAGFDLGVKSLRGVVGKDL